MNKKAKPTTVKGKMYRYFDPTTTQPMMYAVKPFRFEKMISPWSGKEVVYDPANWIECREGEEMIEIPKGDHYIPKPINDTPTVKKA